MRLKWYDIPILSIFFPVLVVALSVAVIFCGIHWVLKYYIDTLYQD